MIEDNGQSRHYFQLEMGILRLPRVDVEGKLLGNEQASSYR